MEAYIHEWIHHICTLIPFFMIYYFIVEYFNLHQFKVLKIKSPFLTIILVTLISSIPQCSITIMMVLLFSQHKISYGALVSSFIASNDESILLLLGGDYQNQLILFICLKIFLAIISGFIIDLIPFHHASFDHRMLNQHHHKNIFLGVLNHTFKLVLLLTISMLISEILLQYIPVKEALSFLPPKVLFALLGFIPGCSIPILGISLLNQKIISFFTYCCLLTTCNGYGLVVLFKNHYKSKLIFILILVLCMNAFILSLLSEVLI